VLSEVLGFFFSKKKYNFRIIAYFAHTFTAEIMLYVRAMQRFNSIFIRV